MKKIDLPALVESDNAPLPPVNAVEESDLLKLVLPADTKETALYLITPILGGKPRWFEKARLVSFERVEETGLYLITAPARQIKDRGLMAMAAPVVK